MPFAPFALRSLETYARNVRRAPAGGDSPHNSSISRSAETTCCGEEAESPAKPVASRRPARASIAVAHLERAEDPKVHSCTVRCEAATAAAARRLRPECAFASNRCAFATWLQPLGSSVSPHQDELCETRGVLMRARCKAPAPLATVGVAMLAVSARAGVGRRNVERRRGSSLGGGHRARRQPRDRHSHRRRCRIAEPTTGAPRGQSSPPPRPVPREASSRRVLHHGNGLRRSRV